MTSVLIVGCGDIGRRVGRLHRARGDRVIGVVRSEESAHAVVEAGLEPLIVDLDRPERELPKAELVYHFAPPQPEGVTDTRTTRLLSRLPTPRRLVYISTSGVYGDRAGDWVDEASRPRPRTERARRRLDAERQLQEWAAREGAALMILRVGGIYGPGRLPVERLDRVTLVCAEEAPYTNRIHADDLARAGVLVGDRGGAGEIYNVTDDEASSMTAYFHAVADAVGKTRPPCVSLEDAPQHMSPAMLSFLQESRRMRNDKLKALGFELRYPRLADGLPACLTDPVEE